MSTQLAKTALVIPVHNRRDITLRGLRSLARINREGLNVRIFVVDDGSTDGTSGAIREEFPDVELIQGDGSLHYAGGTNRGIEAALDWGADYVVTMNDDAVFHENFLQQLVSTARRLPDTIVGALLLPWNEPHRVFQVGLKWRSASGGWVIPEDLTAFSVPKEAFDVECIVGNCVLFPSAALRENGLLDERNFPFGWGDAQLLMRMRKAGWRLVVEPRSLVWCEPNSYPAPLHTQGLVAAGKALFLNERHPLNLRRQFTALWYSAPSKPKAILAFMVYLMRLILKAVRIQPFAGTKRGIA